MYYYANTSIFYICAMHPRNLISIPLLCIGLFTAPIAALDETAKTANILTLPAFKAAIFEYEKNHLEKAKKHLLKLLQQFPDHPQLLNNLAVIEAQQGNQQRAIELLKAIISANATIHTSYRNLSHIYSDQASQAYRNALSLESKAPNRLKLEFIGTSDDQTLAAKKSIAEQLLKDKQINQPLVEEPQQAFSSAVEKNELFDATHRWANAWSQQNLKVYFSSYIQDYAPPRSNHQKWRKQRSHRITKPSHIKIKLDNLRITALDKGQAKVVFRQSYTSNLLSSTVIKQLTMKHIDGGWRIIGEKVISR